MAHMVNCIKLGREAEGLDYPPLPGALGMKIYNNVSKEAWEQWKHLQTMIVNENRLSMADPGARKWLMDQIEAHFFGEGVAHRRLCRAGKQERITVFELFKRAVAKLCRKQAFNSSFVFKNLTYRK